MAQEFRLPGSTYEELVNIIVAYGTRDEASNPGDVGKLNSVHQSSVSRNNAFLTGIGVLRGEREKLVTRRGRSLALALARKDREGIRDNWRAVVSTSEFLQNVVSAVKLREGMLYPTVQAYIAHAAGQPRNKPVMSGAGALIEILKAANLLKEEAGELVATFDEDLKDELPEPEEEATPEERPAKETVSAVVAGEDIEATGEEGGGAKVQVHLHISCTADEIEDLGPKLKALIQDLSSPR
ncbi:MAG TPA: hypothetical protein VFJ72_00695 [Rubrobacteraceae bacterium]|nr:hypothetical protein [Rubrobacteraceae bacterium]